MPEFLGNGTQLWDTMPAVRFLALAGALVQIGCFAAIQIGRSEGRGRIVLAWQLVAALAVLISVPAEFNLPTMLLQSTRALTCIILLAMSARVVRRAGSRRERACVRRTKSEARGSAR